MKHLSLTNGISEASIALAEIIYRQMRDDEKIIMATTFGATYITLAAEDPSFYLGPEKEIIADFSTIRIIIMDDENREKKKKGIITLVLDIMHKAEQRVFDRLAGRPGVPNRIQEVEIAQPHMAELVQRAFLRLADLAARLQSDDPDNWQVNNYDIF